MKEEHEDWVYVWKIRGEEKELEGDFMVWKLSELEILLLIFTKKNTKKSIKISPNHPQLILKYFFAKPNIQ